MKHFFEKHLKESIVMFLSFWMGNWMGTAYETSVGSIADRLLAAVDPTAFVRHPFRVSFAPFALLTGLLTAMVAALAIYTSTVTKQKRMPNEEYGSARWGTEDDIKPLLDPVYANNIILTSTEMIKLEGFIVGYNLNRNVLIIGAAGTGKTRGVLGENILQGNSNYIITDPKGEMLTKFGMALIKMGYKVKVFNLKDPAKSDKYNIFNYIFDENDIHKLAKNLIMNMKDDPSVKPNSDPIWEEGMTALIEAIVWYVKYELKPNEQNMNSVMEVFRLLEVRENDPHFVSPLDVLFNDLSLNKPNNFASKQYKIYKMAAAKTAQSINVSLGLRLSSFNLPGIESIVDGDTLSLDDFGKDEKCALFIVTPDTTRAFNFLAAVMYQQLFDMLIRKADAQPNGRLPRPCQFILDEFANIGKIPDFEILISTMRSRAMSCIIAYQSFAQLKNQYKDDWGTILDNCSSLLFLGGANQYENLEYISKMLGKRTIEAQNSSESHGGQGSFTKSWQEVGRELMTPDEIRRDDSQNCILFIAGLPPFHSKKYKLENHPNYHLTSEADPENAFTYEKRAEMQMKGLLENVETVKTVTIT